MQILSLPPDPFSSILVTLGEAQYTIEARLNSRANGGLGRYSIVIGDNTGAPLTSPIPLLIGANLLRAYQYDERLPKGALFVFGPQVIDPEGTEGEFADGARCALAFFTEAELLAI